MRDEDQMISALDTNYAKQPWREIPRDLLDLFGSIVTGSDKKRYRGIVKALRWFEDNGFLRLDSTERGGLPVLTPKGQRAAVGLGYNKVALAGDPEEEHDGE